MAAVSNNGGAVAAYLSSHPLEGLYGQTPGHLNVKITLGVSNEASQDRKALGLGGDKQSANQALSVGPDLATSHTANLVVVCPRLKWMRVAHCWHKGVLSVNNV